MHVNPHGTVRYLNEHARHWLGVEDDTSRVLLRQPTLWLARAPLQLAQVDAALPPLLATCLSARTPVSARLRTPQNQALVALATPLRGHGAAREDPLVQFVLVPETLSEPQAAMPVCSALYGLTPAEAALLPLLLQGMTPREMAENQGVKMPTVRTQLASLYAKTGTRGQAELAQRVQRVAALVEP